MIRIIAKLFAVTAALIAFLPVQRSSAGGIAFVSASGGGSACTQTAPCASFQAAGATLPDDGGRIICMTPVAQTVTGFSLAGGATVVFDCPSTSWIGNLVISGSGVYKFQHIGFSGLGVSTPISKVTGGGTLIFEDCVIEDVAGTALDIEPTGPLNLVIKNSRISNSAAGVLIKPAAGGGVTATFDGVTLADNTGGALKTDSTNGPVTIDITDSVVSKNGGNGINALGATNQNMVSIKNSVITKNAVAGVQANGALVGVLVQTTLFDQNATGATSVVGGGHISTYGNNSIVGADGSGFTGTAALR
jgi:hypothetical protein